MVSIKVLETNEKTGEMSFLLSDASPALANAIRRIVLEEVPTLAIEKVEFSNNNSILYDEVIAHRLGLTPLSSDLETYVLPDQCSCEGEGCARCMVELSLKEKGPGGVKAGSIKSKDPKVIPVHTEMPIVKLLKGQEIEFVATAVLGTGKDHAKWVPGNIWYNYLPKVTINQKSKKLDECRDQYPQEIFKPDGSIDTEALKKPDVDPKLIDACAGVCDDVISVEYDENSFVFHVESWGQLNPVEIVSAALDKLDEKFGQFEENLKAV